MQSTGLIFWLTGLSGAGKSTMAILLQNYLRSLERPCVLLDGDELRSVVDATHYYDRKERIRLGIQYGKLCALLASQGIDVVIATIALYDEIHAWKEENLPSCCTIFLDVPIEELRRRDPKQIYKRYFSKELANVAGLDLPVDSPRNPTLHIKWHEGIDQDTTWELILNQVKGLLAG